MKKSTITLGVLCLLWMSLIFILSSQRSDLSTMHSDSVTRTILDVLEPEKDHVAPKVSYQQDTTVVEEKPISDMSVVPKKDLFGVNRYSFKSFVRKLAHFFIYFVLGVLVFAFFSSLFHSKKLKALFFSLAFCFLYGMLDEIHQLYVPGRGATLSDVFLDFGGSMGGIFFFGCLYSLFSILKFHFNRVKERKQ